MIHGEAGPLMVSAPEEKIPVTPKATSRAYVSVPDDPDEKLLLLDVVPAFVLSTAPDALIPDHSKTLAFMELAPDTTIATKVEDT